jgi:signal transduction histidine kinase
VGPEIPKFEIALLFNQHRRAKSAQESGQPGWGLGLTLVKGVIDAHHGSVTVESETGKGTRFILEIPSADPRAA